MRYRDAGVFRQALEQRLKNTAAGDGARLARDRKRVAFDRLLARLLAVAPGRWLLKGGFALDVRLAARARATKDVDIEWQATAEELLETLIAAAGHDAGDFFTFTISRTDTPAERLGGSHRFRAVASLAGRPFETFLLDAGIHDGEHVVGETVVTNDLLAFAGIPPVELEAIPLELHVAEKLHAYTRTYEGSRQSTRVKDLVDLALIAELSQLEAGRLLDAIVTTFADRGTHARPEALPAPPTGWALQYRELAAAIGVPADVDQGHATAAALLDPILADEISSARWDPGQERWIPADLR